MTTKFPLAVAKDGIHFEDAAGTPFLWMGDTSWPLLSSYPEAEAKDYITTRAEQGFNVIQSVFTWAMQTDEENGQHLEYEDLRPDANEHGDAPWTDDPSKLNDAYFDYCDMLFEHAEQQGVSLLVIGIWGNYVVEQGIIDAKVAYDIGLYLGTRFKDRKNLLWMNGGDRLPTGYEDIWNAYAKGVRDGGAKQLMTYHPTGAFTSSYFWHDADWLDFNFIQSWGSWTRIYNLVTADLVRQPHKPCVLGEGAYEDGPEYPTGPITPNLVRRQAAFAWFAGGGSTYGQNQSWRMGKGWEQTRHSVGATQLHHIKNLLIERNFQDLIPDQSVLYEGGGVGRHQRAALRSLDRQHWTIYLPEPGMQTIAIDRVAGANVQATWVDPRTGEREDGGLHETTNERGIIFPAFEDPRAFKTPRYFEDSILLLDARPA